VLAEGSDVSYLTAGPSGTLYAYAQGLSCTLVKSNDGGRRWVAIGGVTDAIADISVSMTDPNLIYYATVSQVYRSGDGGNHFISLPPVPSAGTGNIVITSLAAGGGMIAAATRDYDTAEYGGVYLLDETALIPVWEDTGIGNYDVFTLAFPPDFPIYHQITAVVTDETDTFVFNKIAGSGWNVFTGPARLSRDNAGFPVTVEESADIAFPADYQTTDGDDAVRCVYVAISTSTNTGDAYKVICRDMPSDSTAIDLNAGGRYSIDNIDMTSLSVYQESGSTIIIAGADDARIFISLDGGTNWTKNRKAPTGTNHTYVVIPPDFNTGAVMYAATSGDGSGVSISRDLGTTWNGIGLIDARISRLVDFTPSPGYDRDNTLFLITHDNNRASPSLWRTQDSGANWERLLSGDNPGITTMNQIGLPPLYSTDGTVLYIAGESGANPAVWISEDNGQSFRLYPTLDPSAGAAFPIDDMAIIDNDSLLIASHDLSRSMVFRSDNKGFTYSAGISAGLYMISSLELSPTYPEDSAVLAGNTHGQVFLSINAGVSFTLLPSETGGSLLSGTMQAVFDPRYGTNHHIYTVDNTAGAGIFRFTIGESDAWTSIDTNLLATTVIDDIYVSDNGVLYAANSVIDAGMERGIDPQSPHPGFDTVTDGLINGLVLDRITGSGRRLWGGDMSHGKLITYEDTLTAPVILSTPIDSSNGLGTLVDHEIKNITIDWEPLEGTESYEWQCAVSGDFSDIPSDLHGTTGSSYVRLPPLEPTTGYTWRIRAKTPVSSRWSELRTFTTSLDTRTVELKLESPGAGATDVSIRPIFQWTAVMGASSYELLVADNADFTGPAVIKTGDDTLPSNAWECDISLNYDQTYYWKVQALSAGSQSPWSAVGVFTTGVYDLAAEDPPEIQPEARLLGKQDTLMNLAQPRNTPSYPPAVTTTVPVFISNPAPETNALNSVPAWLIYFIGGLLAIVMLALVIILAVILKIKRF
jgi:photosystem II stability/assembly factor-like uncharacterized protein